LPLLDRNGWKAESFDVVAYDDLDAALAAKLPEQKLGVLVSNDIHPRQLAPVQDRLDLIAVAFPKHSDGRGFSLGRMLRQQGYAGTLRASGHILPDQFGFALHDGFDEVEIDDAQARAPAGRAMAPRPRFDQRELPAALAGGPAADLPRSGRPRGRAQ
jgi:uncharacterized protein (DUF934 family)